MHVATSFLPNEEAAWALPAVWQFVSLESNFNCGCHTQNNIKQQRICVNMSVRACVSACRECMHGANDTMCFNSITHSRMHAHGHSNSK